VRKKAVLCRQEEDTLHTDSILNENLEVPVYFLKSKQGYIARKIEKKINGYSTC
jgi:hypothetical protein